MGPDRPSATGAGLTRSHTVLRVGALRRPLRARRGALLPAPPPSLTPPRVGGRPDVVLVPVRLAPSSSTTTSNVPRTGVREAESVDNGRAPRRPKRLENQRSLAFEDYGSPPRRLTLRRRLPPCRFGIARAQGDDLLEAGPHRPSPRGFDRGFMMRPRRKTTRHRDPAIRDPACIASRALRRLLPRLDPVEACPRTAHILVDCGVHGQVREQSRRFERRDRRNPRGDGGRPR
jgi:hypothetical protein